VNTALVVYLEGEPCLTAESGGGVPGQMRALFARLDADMDAGIELDGAWLAAPDSRQRCRFVLGRMLQALEEQQSDFARALLIYLAGRWPELRAVHVRRTESGWSVSLEES